MLRSTISKIKRVCTIAFLPRTLRATRKPSGKFEKFPHAAAVSKIQTRSKSDAKDHEANEQKGYEFAFASAKPPRKGISRFDIHDDPAQKADLLSRRKADILNRKPDLSSRVLINEESECEKCEKLIAKAFGVDHDSCERNPIGDNDNNVEEVRDQATREDEETDPDIDSARAEERARIGRAETSHTQSNILENIAHVNLASNKNTKFSDERVKDAEVHLSDVYRSKENSNQFIELTTLRATIEKEVEEKLAQKIEKIDETPIFEAKKPEIEGFNVTPRTLEQHEKLNFTDIKDKSISVEKIEGEKLDELANRCVNAPDDEIDERLLREMESLKASQTNQNAHNPMYEEDVAKMEVVEDKLNVTEQSHMEYDEKEEMKQNIDFNILHRLYPTFDGPLSEKDAPHEDTSPSMCKPERAFIKEKIIFYEEANEEASDEASEKVNVNASKEAYEDAQEQPFDGAYVGFKSIETIKSVGLDENFGLDRPKVYPNQVLIDPYGKSTLAHEQDESDSTNTYDHVCVKEPMEQIKVMKEIDKVKEVPEEEPGKEELDPKYVVTCNETCPISAECLASTSINAEPSSLKGAEAIYDDFASSDMKKNAVKQVAIANNFDNKISDSSNVDEHEKTEAKPIIETVDAPESVEEESSRSPEKETSQEPKVTEKQISESVHQSETLEEPNLSREPNLKVSEPMQRNLASNCTIPLPKLNDDQASLSELLRRVRERNRIEYCKAMDTNSSAIEHLGSQAAVVEPEIGKCGKKPTPCPPPAPKCPPPEPCPAPCPPPPPTCPKPCKPACPPGKPTCPPKKDPCAKFTTAGLGVPSLISIIFHPGIYPSLPVMITAFNINRKIIDDVITNQVSIKAVLTDEIIIKLYNLSGVLFGYFQRNQLWGSQYCRFQKTTQKDRFVVKDFEPWTPIPSWPIPQKEVKRPLVCPKEGCKLVPPPKLNPPCQLNPCLNFPKRTFSLVELLILCIKRPQMYHHE